MSIQNEGDGYPLADIGDPQVWIMMCEEIVDTEATLQSVRLQLLDNERALDRAKQQANEALIAANWGVFGDTLDLSRRLGAVSSDGFSLFNTFSKLDRRALTIRHAYERRLLRYGHDMAQLPPANYVTRAIGEDDVREWYTPWVAARAGIEVYRQIVGENRPDVTIGAGFLPLQPWAMFMRTELIRAIQKTQLLRIVLSPEPARTAEQFGKASIIEQQGVPSPLSEQEKSALPRGTSENSWLETAWLSCAEIEPVAYGLTIDQG